jgi:hypothetical protein
MKIIQFNAENVKKLRAVEIKPDGNIIEITGSNEQGKSTVLDSIWYALGGKEAMKGMTKPIHTGEKKASVKLDLGDLVVTRSWTAKDTYLHVTTKDGATYPSPQAMLDTLVGRLSFDPLSFANMDDGSAEGKRKQRESLLKLVDLGIDLTAWAKDRQDTVDTRALLGRNIKDAESQLKMMATVPDNIPEEEISISQLTEEFKTAQDIKTANDAKRKLLSDKRGEAEQLQTEILTREKTINSMKANLKELEDAQLNAKNTLSVRIEHGKTLKAEVDTLQDPDMDAITSKMSGVEENNRMVRIKAKRKETEDVLAREKKSYDEKTAEIDALDKKKLNALKSAKFPIPNLSFDEEGVLYKDLPFAQASSTERLTVSFAIAMAMNPKLRVIRITEGSSIDSKHMKIISDMAADKDFQVWIEKTNETGELGIFIEDGMVKKNNYEKKGKTNE